MITATADNEATATPEQSSGGLITTEQATAGLTALQQLCLWSKDRQTQRNNKTKVKRLGWVCYCLEATPGNNKKSTSGKTYVGSTNNMYRRSRQHNGSISGGARYTRAGRPWKTRLVVAGFGTRQQANRFEWAWKYCSRRCRVSTTNRGVSKALQRRAIGLNDLLCKKRWTSKGTEEEAKQKLFVGVFVGEEDATEETSHPSWLFSQSHVATVFVRGGADEASSSRP